jgi:TetR/AcrR family transcriptional regulator, lmrAB and yxaGH operons repressor
VLSIWVPQAGSGGFAKKRGRLYLSRTFSTERRPVASTHSKARSDAVEKLLGVFRHDGYAGASLADLSAASGLGRSSLYHHFPGGKEDMARAVLDRVDAWLTETTEPLTDSGSPPATRLKRFTTALDTFYAGGRAPCILGAFVVGSGRELLGPRLATAFERWIGSLAALVRDAGVPQAEARRRAERVVVAVQGALVLSAALDDPGPFRRVLDGMQAELLG